MTVSGWEGSAALKRLMLLRVRARARSLGSSLKQPKRLLLLVFLGALLSLIILGQSNSSAEHGAFAGANATRMVSLLLTFFFVTTTATAMSNGVIAFSAAEMQFYFPGPIGTRALVGCHLVTSMFKSLSASAVFSLFLRPWDTPYLQAVGAYLVLFLALVLLGVNVDLTLLDTPRARRKRMARGFVVLVFVGVASALLTQMLSNDMQFRPEMLDTLGFPTLPFVGLLTAESLNAVGPSLSMCLGIIALLAVKPLAFRGNIRESSMHSSEQVQKQLKRLAKGNLGQDAAHKTGGRVLPMLPRWGGAGVHVWRQLSSLSRRRKSYALLLVFALLTGIGVGIKTFDQMPSLMAGMMVGMLTFAGPLYVQCDFRSDYDSLAYLRSLPSPPSALAAGQVLASALVIYAFQLLLGTWIFAFLEPGQYALWIGVFLTLPLFNLLQLCVENGAFLLYPVRLDYTRGPPGAVQIGRMYALMLVKFLTLGVAVLCSVLPGWAVAHWLGLPMLGVALSFGLLLLEVALLIWLLGRIFVRVDPGRDLRN